MKKFIKAQKGQFVIIAVMMIAIMIISIGALMHRAVTYYRHEPWDEYLALIGSIELNSKRLVVLSLADYSKKVSLADYGNNIDREVLKRNLENWKANMSKILLGKGAALNYELANQPHNIYEVTINYYLGLNHTWDKPISFTAAKATFILNITTIGLSGYKFDAAPFLKIMNVSNPTYINNGKIWKINVTITEENNNPVAGLEDNISISGFSCTDVTVTSAYSSQYGIVYTIECQGVPSKPSNAILHVYDERGIRVQAKYT